MRTTRVLSKSEVSGGREEGFGESRLPHVFFFLCSLFLHKLRVFFGLTRSGPVWLNSILDQTVSFDLVKDCKRNDLAQNS